MRPAAVTGGSGFLGGCLLERLTGAGPVRALFRQDDEISRSWAARGCSVIYGDLDDKPALDRLVQGADAVYHCAATMGKGDERLSRHVNVAGTQRIAAAAAHAGVRRIVYVSSISVFGATPNPGRTITEAVQPEHVDKLNPYSRTKYEGELVVRRIRDEMGLPFTLVRPTNIYGPGSGPWFLAFERMLRRIPVAFGDLPIDVVYVDDVVDALIGAAQCPAAEDKVFHVGHEMVKLSLFIGEIARVTGQTAYPLHPWLDRMLRVAIDRLYRVFTGSRMSLSLVDPVSYPHDAASRDFGYAPAIRVPEGFARISAALRTVPE